MLKLLKFIIVYLVTISSAFAQNSHSNDDIQSRVNKDYAYLDRLYKHLHSNPEISLQEEKTAKKLTDELSKLGFKVTQNVG
ncbi:amidohydrolase, partial [candidate division KSB1 bacterium]|nr:amidohydrolase [candidate division KSB1 bacterium]